MEGKNKIPNNGISYPGTRGMELPGMPIGGIGTSTFEIGLDGAFKNNRLQNAWTMSLPNRPTGMAPGSFLAVFVKPDGADGTGRVLQMDAPGELPGIPNLTYIGQFPFVHLKYKDPALPAQMSMEAFSPFVPLNSNDSSLPLAFMTLRIHNPTNQSLRVVAAMSWVNDIASEYYFRGWPPIGNINTITELSGATAVQMTTRDETLSGSEYLLAGLPEEGVEWHAVADWMKHPPGRIVGRNLFVEEVADNNFQPFEVWRIFLAKGQMPAESRYNDGLEKYSQHCPAGAVAGAISVPPGESRSISWALGWYFPWLYDRNSGTGCRMIGHHYARRFPGGAAEVLAANIPRRHELAERSRAWRSLFDRCSLSPDLRSMIMETLYLLSRITWWAADGRFYILESIDCPRITCSILERYTASTLSALFPDLHANLLRNIAAAQLPSGEIPSTLGVRSVHRHEYRMFNPGDVSIFPLAVYWHVLWNEDHEFLAELYPGVKRSLQWGLNELDDDHDGIPDVHGIDQGWDTFPMHGCAAYIADQWMAGLRAGAELARQAGDAEFASWCEKAFTRASATVEEKLWNGAYYDLSLKHDTGKRSSICFTDQFSLGSVPAQILGVGDIHPPDRVRTALESIWRMNVRPVEFVCRAASNADGTPADSSYLKEQAGGHSQSNCFSPVMAAPLACAAIQHGMTDEGLTLLDDLAKTIIHRLREPWSGKLLFDSRTGEWFYGLHYSDCLINWDILYVMLGLTLDAPNRIMRFAPPILPVCLPIIGKIFTGRVQIDKAGLKMENTGEEPCRLDKVSLRVSGKCDVHSENIVIMPGESIRLD